MFTCSKLYPEIPFAHRQHRHNGHCALIHGHNWSFRLTFAAEELDACGFVVDFGSLGYVKEWLFKTFDHACCFNRDDLEGLRLVESHPHFFHAVVIENCSAEGIAQYVCESVGRLVTTETGGRVRVAQVEVFEDTRNAACFKPAD
ncbi:MAG: 6-pyruvoyl tetrahydropterin synthase family protein [Puniceicoccaceae bacterium]